MSRLIELVTIISYLTFAWGRVTFDNAELLDRRDLTSGANTAVFICPTRCKVFTPTASNALSITTGESTVVTSFADLHKRDADEPMELKASAAGTYRVTSGAEPGASPPDFTLYVVRSGAANYDTRVYTRPQQRVNCSKRFVTILTDQPGLRVAGIAGDDADAKPSVFAAGFDSVHECLPVFSSRSLHNAERTSVVIRGPIATVDFGADEGINSVTLDYEYLTKPSTDLGSSTVIVSPGYTGCDTAQLYSISDAYNGGQEQYTLRDDQKAYEQFLFSKVSLKIFADYDIASGAAPVAIVINRETIGLSGSGSMSSELAASKFAVSVTWSRDAGDSRSNFALQIDNLTSASTPFVITNLYIILIFAVLR